MADRTPVWDAGALLRSLADRLAPGLGCVDLNIHSVWALIVARPGAPAAHPGLVVDLRHRGERLLDSGTGSRQSRRELDAVQYGDPETIAEHSFRTAVIGAVLAMMEGADPAKVALMCTFHDTQETRVGDIPWVGRRYLKAAKSEDVTADQVADAHPAVAVGVRAVVEDYANGDSLEVAVAHDADELECMIQGIEYLEQGYRNAQEWGGQHAGEVEDRFGGRACGSRAGDEFCRLAAGVPALRRRGAEVARRDGAAAVVEGVGGSSCGLAAGPGGVFFGGERPLPRESS
ncbi:HD domain-containing protein [Streptomyces sp. NPDC045369]|uniref:HD domain-containing protein n=1 Tax=Streptomyces sp. NPDC045369 TaxID=3155732 RepID=UPI0033C610FD